MRALRHNIRVAGGLTVRDWFTLAEAWGLLLYFRLALRRRSFESLERSIRVTPKAAIGPSSGLELAGRLQRLVGQASKLHLLSMTCLVRALTLQWMLGSRGTPAQVRIGARKAGEGMTAHAWVEVDGQMVGEPEEVRERFKVLSSTG